MINKATHTGWVQVLIMLASTFLAAFSINTFISPQHLYSGGLLGFCQLIRTGLDWVFGLRVESVDLAVILFQLTNVPLTILAWKTMGRTFVAKLILCTVSYSVFMILIPVPEQPLIQDTLASCLVGGILNGVGNGIVLACRGSIGGIGVLWLYLSRKWGFSVGHIHTVYSVALSAAFLILFVPEVAIYSSLFAVVTAAYMDRMHLQNITVQVTIMTKEDSEAMARRIMEDTGRGVTHWVARGAYTGDEVNVLCVCLTKFELDQVQRIVDEMDPHAFITEQEGLHVRGNFPRRLT
ncbi:MAG: YitT family protein [Oscillospiraceae bacterium]|nr:YitT family protein [Oscillospiraceae bacterium]